jgi:hypothetical protein
MTAVDASSFSNPEIRLTTTYSRCCPQWARGQRFRRSDRHGKPALRPARERHDPAVAANPPDGEGTAACRPARIRVRHPVQKRVHRGRGAACGMSRIGIDRAPRACQGNSRHCEFRRPLRRTVASGKNWSYAFATRSPDAFGSRHRLHLMVPTPSLIRLDHGAVTH